MFGVDGKINARILVDSICRKAEGLTDDEQGGFRYIIILRKIVEKAWEKKQRVDVDLRHL